MELTVWRWGGLPAKIPDEEFIVMSVGLDSSRLLEFSWGAVRFLTSLCNQLRLQLGTKQ